MINKYMQDYNKIKIHSVSLFIKCYDGVSDSRTAIWVLKLLTLKLWKWKQKNTEYITGRALLLMIIIYFVSIAQFTNTSKIVSPTVTWSIECLPVARVRFPRELGFITLGLDVWPLCVYCSMLSLAEVLHSTNNRIRESCPCALCNTCVCFIYPGRS